MRRRANGESAKGPGLRLVVDGEVFTVHTQRYRPGGYNFAWDSGPNEGYGFSLGTSTGTSLTEAQLEEEARGFLRNVDPETGYIG